MSYDYALFYLSDNSVNRLEDVVENSMQDWPYEIDHIKEVISEILPKLKWGWGEGTKNEDNNYGQIINAEWGRFECSIDEKYPFLKLDTSVHQDYKNYVIDIAKALNLTAFDVQTGEIVYKQKKL